MDLGFLMVPLLTRNTGFVPIYACSLLGTKKCIPTTGNIPQGFLSLSSEDTTQIFRLQNKSIMHWLTGSPKASFAFLIAFVANE
jgi:hypothetical protein